jgi:hypothetical protein
LIEISSQEVDVDYLEVQHRWDRNQIVVKSRSLSQNVQNKSW